MAIKPAITSGLAHDSDDTPGRAARFIRVTLDTEKKSFFKEVGEASDAS